MASHSTLPPIPEIEGVELTLSVFTHRTLLGHQSPDDFNNSERLSTLGERVLHLAVTEHFFRKRPPLSAEHIEAETARILSIENYQHWVDGYGLRQKLRVIPNMENPLDSPEELQMFFHSYVAAVFLHSRMITINDWISQLIDPESPAPDYVAHQPPHYDAPPPRAAPPPLPSNPPQSLLGTSGPSLITLAAFHEYAVKNGLQVTYQAKSEGQSHLPIWTVRCFVNNEEKGFGQGKNQKAAKEEAVKRAWTTMGL